MKRKGRALIESKLRGFVAGISVVLCLSGGGALAGEERDGRVALESRLAGLDPKVRVGITAFRVADQEDAAGPGAFAKNADAVLPTASAIKTAIMIELFAKFHDALDVPPPSLDAILADDHPAVAHFEPKPRAEIREGLSGSGVRRIGRVMLGSEEAPNHVYNAASNVAIALLGGPEETTRLIHERDPAFGSIQVRRYMLTDRTVRGDNEATAEGLAAVLRRLASRTIPGLDPAAVEACRMAVEIADDPARGRRFFKDGALDSTPITRVATGWYEPADGPPIVYAVMLAQDAPGAASTAETAAKLAATVGELAKAAVDALQKPADGP